MQQLLGSSQSEPLIPDFSNDRRNEFGERVRWDRRVHHDEVYHPHQPRNGRNISQEVERKPRIERGIYGACDREHEQPVAIGLRTDDRLGGDVAGGAGPVLNDKRLTERLRQPLRHDTGHNVRSGRPASGEDGVFGKENTRVGAVITTGFALPTQYAAQGGAAFRILASSKAAGGRRSVEGGAWHALYTLLLAYRIGSYIPVPGIDPAAFERVMALEDRSVLS
jgi:hypothetical protein